MPAAPLFSRRPPLWLAVCAVTAANAVAFGVARWLDHFKTDPNAEDIRVWIVASRIGLKYGWAHIYDLDLQRASSVGLGANDSVISSHYLFVGSPPTAWLMVPLAPLPLSIGYLAWTIVSLAAFVAACWLVVPGGRFARLTILLVSLALWPVHYQFWLGQWVAMTVALLAVCWWLLKNGRWTAAGVMLALAFCVKPQDLLLLPVALLLSGRWRPILAFAVTTVAIAAASALAIGTSGAQAWLHDLSQARIDLFNAPLTYFYAFGSTQAATAVELALGAAALLAVWFRRDRLDLVFALGLVGTTASAPYLHEYDVAILVLPAWIVLGSSPSWALRAWLLGGLVAAQFIAIGLPLPILLWEPTWIVLLALEPDLQALEARRRRRLGSDEIAKPLAGLRGG